MSEHPLHGGSVNTVVRVGDTVRRPPSGRFVRELLGFFKVRGAFRWVAEHRSELEVS